ncbi:hypothetical protein BKA59DRAFT_33735 [Fusarium tricinctum]|uniref:Beta-ketoacyl synthase n=2 Tax=Fusarium tricinctum species complex TaxID=679429 RepID=A0A8K0S9D7_9HYPO|nr:hypothetical protein BKA59DRAFT_33735 [Fusarium tricinctum]
MADNRSRDPQWALLHQQQSSRGLFSPEIIDLVLPPLKFGGYAGTAGVLAGVGGSIFKEANPIVWGAISGFQWFTLGTSFWFTRSIVVKAWGGEERLKNGDKTMASAIAGTAAGAVGGLIRGPKNILPAMFVWTVFGTGGQIVANRMAARKPKIQDENDETFFTRWTPLKKLTDQEYRDMMSEKMLRIDADIALIDDRVAELRKQAEEEAQSSSSP